MTIKTTHQPGIFAHIPTHARYLRYSRAKDATAADLRVILQALAPLVDGEQVVLGLGPALLKDLSPRAAGKIPGLHDFAAPAGSKVAWPHSPADLWLWLRAAPGQDVGHLHALTQLLNSVLQPAFELLDAVDQVALDVELLDVKAAPKADASEEQPAAAADAKAKK